MAQGVRKMSQASREALKRWRTKNPKKSSIYRKTFHGYYCEVYGRIRKRVAGGDERYVGLQIMSPSDWDIFLDTTLLDRQILWRAWVKSGYKLRMAPSIDRINSQWGYTLGNCRWLPQWENSSNGGKATGICKNRYLAAGK